MKNGKLVIGIDLGATNTRGAIVENKNIIHEVNITTPSNYAKNSISDHIADLIEKLFSISKINSTELSAIGIGVPGTVDIKKGLIVECPNTPLKNIPIVEELKNKYPFPAFIDNDANVAAIGERYFGEGRGVSNFICLTLGTGIGGGIFINGKIYRGFSDSAGEVGHLIIDVNGPKCGCQSNGCLEAMASGTAIKRLAREHAAKNPHSLINKLASGNIENIKGEYVTEAAQQGE